MKTKHLIATLFTLSLLASTHAVANGSKLPPAKPLAGNWIAWVMQIVEG